MDSRIAVKVLCLIPARGGSKTMPRKNLAQAGGRPLIDWAVAAADGAGPTTRIVVSTDDEEIAEHALAVGAEVPFIRPAALAADHTPGIDPILHAVAALDLEGYQPDIVVCLQPTSPLRTADDVSKVLTLFDEVRVDSVVSVSQVRHHPLWMKTIDADGWLQSATARPAPATRQELPLIYVLNGAIYAARREVLMRTRSWYTDHTRAYVMPSERSWDVDTAFDLRVADLLLREASA